jgi:hypothetical protein
MMIAGIAVLRGAQISSFSTWTTAALGKKPEHLRHTEKETRGPHPGKARAWHSVSAETSPMN